MQIEKPLINDRLRVSKISWKFHIPTIYNFAVIYPWNLLYFKKVAYFLTVSIVFSFINKTLRLNNLKTGRAMNVTISVFVICIEAIICWLLYNLHDCTFNVFMSVRSFRWGFFRLLWNDHTTCSKSFYCWLWAGKYPLDMFWFLRLCTLILLAFLHCNKNVEFLSDFLTSSLFKKLQRIFPIKIIEVNWI